MSIELTPTLLRAHSVLYVDDHDWSRTVFARTVRSFVAVDVAESAAQAIEMLHHRAYSALVTDLRMPGMNGIDLCVLVREQFPRVQRMLVTAYGDLETAADAINRGGISHFITKPWKSDFLLHALKEVLTRVELERTVHALQDDIKKREIELVLGEQYGRIVHDLSSLPLPIRTALIDLQQVLDDPALPAESREVIEQQASTLNLVIDHVESILHRSRDIELTPPRRRPYRVLTALETSRAMVARQRGPLQIELECDRSGLEFMADLTDVTRVLVNLVRNALDAISDAGMTDGRVVMAARADGPVTVIDVMDNGPGIPPPERDAIFEPGYSRKGGSGLGLTICRDLTIMNGGTLELSESDEGGCRFTLRLPAPVACRSIA